MMIGWPIISFLLFCLIDRRMAIGIALIGGWLLLPQASGYAFAGLPEYGRATAIILGPLVAIILFDSGRLLHTKWGILDLPMLIWCLSALPSSVSNGLGWYDGASGVLDQLTLYGIPYMFGRCYFDGHYQDRLLYLIVAAGLLLIPLIAIELRLGPIFHRMVYGFEPFKWHQVWRLGWYRPPLFLRTGIALGAWMALCFVCALWAWRTRKFASVLGVRMDLAVLSLLLVLLLMRALNGYVIALLGALTLIASGVLKQRVIALAFILAPVIYIGARVGLDWRADGIIAATESVSTERAESLQSRVGHEVLLIDHALERPVFGWGTYNRNRPTIDQDQWLEGMMSNRSVTDSLWIIALGQKGIVGLTSILAVLLVPALVVACRIPPMRWTLSTYGSTIAFGVVGVCYSYDALFNALHNPIVFTAVGATVAGATRVVVGTQCQVEGEVVARHARRVVVSQ